MARETFVVVANEFDTEADALADYEDVRNVIAGLGILDTFDAVVVMRAADGKVDIVKRVEEPTRHSARAGLAVGLAVGALTALLPAVGLGVALIAGGAIGAGAGAGHVTGGMSKADLEELADLLDNGTSGLLVVAATDLEESVAGAITRADGQATGAPRRPRHAQAGACPRRRLTGSHSTPTAFATRWPETRSDTDSSSALLPAPASPRRTSARLRPGGASAKIPSGTSNSPRRPRSAIAASRWHEPLRVDASTRPPRLVSRRRSGYGSGSAPLGRDSRRTDSASMTATVAGRSHQAETPWCSSSQVRASAAARPAATRGSSPTTKSHQKRAKARARLMRVLGRWV